MPWKTQQDACDIMMFNGISDSPSTSTRTLRKRKNEFECGRPIKQHISESKMSAFLNGLHISNDYQSHSINITDKTFEEEMDSTYDVNMSPQELEERLKHAQRITLCEDAKKTLEESNRDEIYKVLVDRIERPCTALVLWKPPKPIEQLITNFKSKNSDDNEVNDNEEEKMILE